MPHHGTHAACGKILFHMAPFTLRVLALAASLAFAASAQLKPTLKPADYGQVGDARPGRPFARRQVAGARNPPYRQERRIARRARRRRQDARAGVLLEPRVFRRFALAGLRSHGFRGRTGQAQEGQEAGPEQDGRAGTGHGSRHHRGRRAIAGVLRRRGVPGVPALPAHARTRRRGGRGGSAEPGDPAGSTLTVRNLATGIDTTFGNVTGFAWQDNGTNLAMTIGVEGRTGNAIQVFDPKAGSLRVLDSGPAVFTALAWRKESSDLAALRSVKQDGLRRRELRRARVEEPGREALGPRGRAEAHRRVARRPNGRRTARSSTWASPSG